MSGVINSIFYIIWSQPLKMILHAIRRMIIKCSASAINKAVTNLQNRYEKSAVAMPVLALHARMAVATERPTKFDTDSETIGVDNRCSGCISHMKSDFIGELKQTNKVVKGFAGSRTTNVKIGTLGWSWNDDQGLKHTFHIPDSYYIRMDICDY